jgi:hypothetical protein
MSTEPIASQALRANLERTRRALEDVELPAEHEWLLGLSNGTPGVHRRATSCLWELSHPLPDLGQLTLHEEVGTDGQHRFSRQSLNGLHRAATEGPQRGLLELSERQNVSSDFRGRHAAVIIEGTETHTRVGFIEIPAGSLRAQGIEAPGPLRVPVTHAKVFGWYDNEYGSCVYSLGELTRYVDSCLA